MIINLYRINPDNSYGGMEESYSEADIDLSHYTPPKGFTFSSPYKETDIWNGEAWVEPPIPYVPTLEETKEAKKAEIAQARYEAEIAGIYGIKTDRESQALLTGAILQAVIDPTYTLEWKTADGTFVFLTAEEVKVVGASVRAYIQGCFTKESALCTLIDKTLSVEEVEAVTWES